MQFFTIFLWFLTQIYRILLLYHKSNVSRETLLLFYLFTIVSRETINRPFYNRKRFYTPNLHVCNRDWCSEFLFTTIIVLLCMDKIILSCFCKISPRLRQNGDKFSREKFLAILTQGVKMTIFKSLILLKILPKLRDYCLSNHFEKFHVKQSKKVFKILN